MGEAAVAVDRPTFSESWHRVAELRPRLRSLVQVHRQRYRGKLWYVLRDPSTNQFFRIDDAAYAFVALLDGRRTVARAWEIVCEQLEDRAATQGEAIGLLGQLYVNNLLHADLPADAAGMFERQRKRVRREVGGYVMNLLFARVPVFDPDRLLDRWVGVLGWAFSPMGLGLWLVVMACGAWSLLGEGAGLAQGAEGVLSPGNLIWLYVAFVGIKAAHELGHGIACKKFGQLENDSGEVHTVGVMLMVLTPVPYVDASSAWAFRSKWHRAVVGAAGMYVELAVAAVAAVVWTRTSEGAAVHAIAYNMMLIASVSTLLFNGNPLLRFDGYYILCDVLEIPNLNQRSREYLHYLVKRYVFGVRQCRNPAHSGSERWWLVFYGVASAVYRVLIGVGIILFVANRLFFIGAAMAIGAVVGWVVAPTWKFIRYVLTSGELGRVRGRAMGATAGFAGVVFVVVGLIPLAEHGRAEGVVQARQEAVVYAGSDGFLTAVVKSGSRVEPGGQAVVTLENPELLMLRERLQAEKRMYEATFRQERTKDVAAAQVVLEQLAAIEQRLVRVEEQIGLLEVHAPFAGTWVGMDAERSAGMFLKRGAAVGLVASLEDVLIRVTADQYLGPRLEGEVGVGGMVELKVWGAAQETGRAVIERILPAGRRQLPSAALAHEVGGPMAVVEGSPEDGRRSQSAEPFFEVRIRPTAEAAQACGLLPGQRVVVRFELPRRPLAAQGWRMLRQLLQKRLRL
jgi:putative peptide zinc metalloprotease protein